MNGTRMVTDVEADATRVVLDGPLTVRTIASVKATLLQALAEYHTVQVDCGTADSADLSLIQLLLAARQSAQRTGKALHLAAPAQGALREALVQGGFLAETGADPFWSGRA